MEIASCIKVASSTICAPMTSSNSSSLSRVWLRANCCRCGDARQDAANNNSKNAETPLREETETLLHRIAFTVWHTALHIESEVRVRIARVSYTRVRNVSIMLLLQIRILVLDFLSHSCEVNFFLAKI